MRIIAGIAKGRRLEGPKGFEVTRPTSDRVRETVFNVLGQWTEGLSVLDLYAGTGALALEAISRGASEAVLIDSDRAAVELCRNNSKSLGFSDRVHVVRGTVEKMVVSLGGDGTAFDLVFVDPPYALRAANQTLNALVSHQLLRPGARVVVEHDRREEVVDSVQSLSQFDHRKFGDTVVSFFMVS